MPKFLDSCHYNEEEISRHLERKKIGYGPVKMNGNKFATGQILKNAVEVVKGWILAGWAPKSPEPWSYVITKLHHLSPLYDLSRKLLTRQKSAKSHPLLLSTEPIASYQVTKSQVACVWMHDVDWVTKHAIYVWLTLLAILGLCS